MAAINSLTLADGQATPANHTFVPDQPQIGSSPAVWYEKTASSITGFQQVTMLNTYNSGTGTARVTIRIALPVLSAPGAGCCVDGKLPPGVAYITRATVEFLIPAAAVLQDKKDILAYVKNFLATPVALNAVTIGEKVW